MMFRLLTAALFLLAASPAPAQPRELTVVSRPGSWEEGLRDIYFRPFAAAAGIPVRAEEPWDGGIEALRAHAKQGDASWDVVLSEAATLHAACDEGILEKLDWSAIGGKEHYLPQAVNECGVGAFLSATVLSWDREKFPGTPGWAEFWDVAKYPGKRGLFRGARGNLEFSLLADGVAPGDVYKQLRTNDGVERAFRRLEQLRPYIVWWQSGTQAPQLLGSGEVLMTSAPNGRLFEANRLHGRNFGTQWAGSLTQVNFWGLIKGGPNLRQAQQFLYFAGTSAIQARLLPYGGLAKGVLEAMPAEAQATAPILPANLTGALATDEAFWRENGAKLDQRFDAWLAR